MKTICAGVLILGSLYGSFPAQAQTPEDPYKIKQIILTKNVVVATSNSGETFEKGKIFLATFKDNTQCSLKVVGQTQNLITLDTSECEAAKSLTLNQPIEPSLYVMEETAIKEKDTSANVNSTPLILPPRTVTDLGYILPQGRLGTLAAFASTTDDAGYYSGSTLASNVTTRQTSLGFNIGYGFSENLNFILGLSMVPGQNTEYSSLNETHFSKGFQDPDLALLYRIISQSDVTPLDITLRLLFSPKTFEAKTATDKADGTMGSGKSVMVFQLGTFRRFKSIELGFLLDYFSRWAGSRTNAESGEVTEDGATESYSLRGIAQFKVAEGFFLNAGLGYSSFSSGENKNTTTNSVTRTMAYTMTGVQAGVRFAIIPDVSSLDFLVSNTVGSNVDVTQGTSKITIKDYKRSSFGVSISYLF